ncbi:hypothetical protein ACFV29_33460 [Streptomyces sp. NPDC059690]|uniref:hypothetical protein n=1 Tax=Streptomyces sp. NPDC059690 TaxID=3346907 RepID=UPI0036AEEE3A
MLTLVGGTRLVAVGVVEIITAVRIRGRARQVPHSLQPLCAPNGRIRHPTR